MPRAGRVMTQRRQWPATKAEARAIVKRRRLESSLLRTVRSRQCGHSSLSSAFTAVRSR